MEPVETDLKIPDSDRIYNYWDYMHEEPPESFDPNDPSFVNAEYIMNMFNKLVDGKYKTRSFKLYNSFTDLTSEEGVIGQTAYVQEEGYENSFFVNDGITWIQFSADKKPTIDYFENNTGTQLDTETELGSVVMVFKNGVLLEPTADYSIVGSTITFLTALEATDKVSVINGDISASNMARYQLKTNLTNDPTETSTKKYPSSAAMLQAINNLLPSRTGHDGQFLSTNNSVLSWESVSSSLFFNNKVASSWVADSTYSGYSYKCEITCNGVTSNMYPIVNFSYADSISGNYCNICETGTNKVTIWSKVNTSITIPTIIVIS